MRVALLDGPELLCALLLTLALLGVVVTDRAVGGGMGGCAEASLPAVAVSTGTSRRAACSQSSDSLALAASQAVGAAPFTLLDTVEGRTWAGCR